LPNNYNSPTTTTNSATSIQGPHKIVSNGTNSSKIYFDVPVSDSYMIKAYYIEYGIDYPSPATTGNTVTLCSNPLTGGCYRWYKMISLPSGSYPTCQNFSIIINQIDPNGFIGNCY